ncbi:hypothetical protein [Mucisphaera sp.]|uniref:hypothetical protein n=1 Tax=Mucisphaera sp. TaxID=2913024 RepID=UPI003D109FB8
MDFEIQELEYQEAEVAKLLAPEDIAPHQYVAISRLIESLQPEEWAEIERFELDEVRPHKISVLPRNSGQPFRVSRVALPYVLVRDHDGRAHVFDLRRIQLSLLPDGFGKAAFLALGEKKRSS